MDLTKLLQPDLQKYIRTNEGADENKLLLSHKTICDVPASWVADQIVGRRKSKTKLPSWYAAKDIVYPPSLNLEQCSSEATAKFKGEIVRQNIKTGFKKIADLTGGFGVDTFCLSSGFETMNYVEPDENLFEIAKHNHSVLQDSNIQRHNTTAEEFLTSTKDTFDVIYIDPSRRTKGNQKIFRFADCQPDVIALMPLIFERSDYLLVKASPLIDLQLGTLELQCVEKIFVVALENECKEVLFLCRKNFKGEAYIEAINLIGSTISAASFGFYPSEEKNSISAFSNPLSYLYEPNAAILKSGAFKIIGNRHHLFKLQQHTHLYTSEKLIASFPGKIFKIEALMKPDAKTALKHFAEGKANIVTRNYPLSPEQLKKKTGLKDGGEKFLIGFSCQTEKFTAVCSRLS